MPNRISQSRPWFVTASVIIVFMACMASMICLSAASAATQTAREVRGAAAVAPLQNEAAAKIIIDPPLAEPLSHGRVVIQYRTDNLHIVPVFGPAALEVSPRIGHMHVALDDAAWVWAHLSGEPLILDGLAAGPHKVRLQLESANHQLLDQGAVNFTVPETLMAGSAAVEPVQNGPAAKIVIDPPLAEPLARGVVFIQYRAENVHLAPVFGPAALAVSPRIGHIHVTVDDAAWHWAEAGGDPVIILGLTPGPHKILFQLVNANHQPIDQGTARFTIPAAKPQPEAH